MSPSLGPDNLPMEPPVGDDTWMACILEVNCSGAGDPDETPLSEEAAE